MAQVLEGEECEEERYCYLEGKVPSRKYQPFVQLTELVSHTKQFKIAQQIYDKFHLDGSVSQPPAVSCHRVFVKQPYITLHLGEED